jgi:hypothetical protein
MVWVAGNCVSWLWVVAYFAGWVKPLGSTNNKPNWGFHKWGIPQNGWFRMEHPI